MRGISRRGSFFPKDIWASSRGLFSASGAAIVYGQPKLRTLHTQQVRTFCQVALEVLPPRWR
jgi:hypothetical protein